MLGGPLRACSSPDLHQLRFPQIPPEFGAERPSASYQKLRRYQHEDLTRDKRGCFLRSRAAWCRGRTIRYRADYPNRLCFRRRSETHLSRTAQLPGFPRPTATRL